MALPYRSATNFSEAKGQPRARTTREAPQRGSRETFNVLRIALAKNWLDVKRIFVSSDGFVHIRIK